MRLSGGKFKGNESLNKWKKNKERLDYDMGPDKGELIELFMETIKKDGRILRYIKEADIREVLDKNIQEVSYRVSYAQNWAAMYCFQEKEIVCRTLYEKDLPTLMHEVFHALSTTYLGLDKNTTKSGVYFSHIWEKENQEEYYERGRELNEGITEYLTRHIFGTSKIDNTEQLDKMKALGVNIVYDASYPVQQQIVEELVALYGEDAVIGSYFETSPEKLVQTIGESGAIKNPESVLTKIMTMLDIQILPGDNKLFKREFSKLQDFITKELIEKEINFAIKSKDPTKLARAKQILENLQGLDVLIDGKNVFENIIETFNRKLEKIPNSNKFIVNQILENNNQAQLNLALRGETQLLPLSGRKNVADFVYMFLFSLIREKALIERGIQRNKFTKRHKNLLGFIAEPRKDIEVNHSPPSDDKVNEEEQKRDALLVAIRGHSKEEYEKSCQEAEQDWESQRNEDSKRNEDRNNQRDGGR